MSDLKAFEIILFQFTVKKKATYPCPSYSASRTEIFKTHGRIHFSAFHIAQRKNSRNAFVDSEFI